MEFNAFQIENLVKIAATAGEVMIVVIMIIYLIHALVLSRRIKIMNLNLKTPYENSFVQLSKIHIIASIIIVILTILSIEF